MRKFSTLLVIFLCNFSSFAQISFTGSSTAISTPVNAPAIIVDNSLVITSGVSFDGAKVSISSNFNSGDVLSYTGSLPSGVTASYNSSTGILTFTGTATPSQYQTLLRTVTFQTSSTNAAQRIILFNLGSATAYSGNNHFYEFVSGAYSWTTAKANAAARSLFGLQGYLATITNASENTFITSKLGSDGWIGASDGSAEVTSISGTTYGEGRWYWVTGPEKGTLISTGNVSPVQQTYMNWNSGEPNNSGSAEHYGEIYVSGSLGKWNDLPNTSTLGYVVEYGGTNGDPVVDLTHSISINLIATSLKTTGTNNGYSLHASAVTVDNALTVYSAANITNATVTISSGFKTGDQLNFNSANLPSGVTGNYNTTTGVLSFTGSSATYSAWQNLLRTVSFSSTSNVIGNRSISFSVGNLISASNGHFYEFVSTGATWTNAKTNAAAKTYLGLTGYLATITSQTENDFIQQKLSADGWVGASDSYTQINAATGITSFADQTAAEGKWYWVTGPEKGTQMTTGNAPNSTSLPPVYGTAYNNWNTGEPNNSSNEHYIQIYSTGGVAPGKWNDLNGTGSLGYVVEYGGLSTDPLLELSASRTIVITSILPVNNLQFVAVKNGRNSELKWTTASEVNTLRFDVMHSVDGSNFSKIGSVAASQNSTATNTYFFVHKAPESGTNYYRLKLVDIDGRNTLSDIRQLSFEKIGFTISPNPVVNSLIVSNPFERNAVLIVTNTSGATVLKQDVGSYQAVLNVKQMAAGIYFARLISDGQQSNIVKFVKE
jgi:hypothetical protein